MDNGESAVGVGQAASRAKAPRQEERSATPSRLGPTDTFVRRHVGPNAQDVADMLQLLGVSSLDELIDQTVPPAIRVKRPLKLGEPRGEFEVLQELQQVASGNKVLRSF